MKYVPNVALNPANVPSPVARTKPATVTVNLTAQEVVGELVPAVLNADGTIDQAIQTYRPTSRDVDEVILGARSKIGRQLANAPTARRVLAVHVDGELMNALRARRLELEELAAQRRVSLDIVDPAGNRWRIEYPQ